MLPNGLTDYQASSHAIFPNFDCKPSGRPARQRAADPNDANCVVQPRFPNQFGGGQAPDLFQDP